MAMAAFPAAGTIAQHALNGLHAATAMLCQLELGVKWERCLQLRLFFLPKNAQARNSQLMWPAAPGSLKNILYDQ